MKEETEYYQIGDLLNPLSRSLLVEKPKVKKCSISVPARVDTFLCHHHYFVNPPRPQVYPVNSINFAIEQFTEAEVSLREDAKITIDPSSSRSTLLEHAVEILRKTLGIEHGFNVNARNVHTILHGGLGSSAALMTAVAQAINLLTGEYITIKEMTKLLAQNYSEETDRPGYLSTMASIGGASASALSGKSLVIVGGEAEIWYTGQLPNTYTALLLYPKEMKSITGVSDMELYRKGFSLFKRLGTEWGDIKESILKNRIIPALQKNDFSELFRAINMYTIGGYGDIPQYFRSRWLSHNIFFDKFIHTLFSRLFTELRIDESCFFVSSGGPLIVIITQDTEKTIESIGDFARYFSLNKVNLARNTPLYKLH